MGEFGGEAIYRLSYKTFCKFKRALRTNAENNVDAQVLLIINHN